MKKALSLLLFICFIFPSAFGQNQGKATYYSPKLTGRRTSDGSRYHPDSLTCAHKSYPLGTYLMVSNPKNGEKVIVKVTDRGPFTKNFMIDLSYSAAKKLDIVRQGVAQVEVNIMDTPPQILSLLPVPIVFLQVKATEQAVSLFNKIFSDDSQKKKTNKQK
jgi:rare lipoprotein A